MNMYADKPYIVFLFSANFSQRVVNTGNANHGLVLLFFYYLRQSSLTRCVNQPKPEYCNKQKHGRKKRENFKNISDGLCVERYTLYSQLR